MRLSPLLLVLVTTITACGSANRPVTHRADSSGADVESSLVCAEVTAHDYDRTCAVASDCVAIETGSVCAGQCSGANDAMRNAPANVALYEADVEPVLTAGCRAAPLGPVACIANRCTVVASVDGAGDPAGAVGVIVGAVASSGGESSSGSDVDCTKDPTNDACSTDDSSVSTGGDDDDDSSSTSSGDDDDDSNDGASDNGHKTHRRGGGAGPIARGVTR